MPLNAAANADQSVQRCLFHVPVALATRRRRSTATPWKASDDPSNLRMARNISLMNMTAVGELTIQLASTLADNHDGPGALPIHFEGSLLDSGPLGLGTPSTSAPPYTKVEFGVAKWLVVIAPAPLRRFPCEVS
ncbi:hypothetical protein AURDEDRAFT_165671 [Auricularia subglabra TFB-10046 SS5]|nr:hypothetical protein AURDEDRAFT_165671 [Auricularia subglabra TFB-10046 SS5]